MVVFHTCPCRTLAFSVQLFTQVYQLRQVGFLGICMDNHYLSRVTLRIEPIHLWQLRLTNSFGLIFHESISYLFPNYLGGFAWSWLFWSLDFSWPVQIPDQGFWSSRTFDLHRKQSRSLLTSECYHPNWMISRRMYRKVPFQYWSQPLVFVKALAFLSLD